MTRREELNDIFKDIDENKKKLINPLLDNVEFLENRLNELKGLPFIKVNPNDITQQKETKAGKLYQSYISRYMDAIRTLLKALNNTDFIDEDPVQEFMRKRGFYAD